MVTGVQTCALPIWRSVVVVVVGEYWVAMAGKSEVGWRVARKASRGGGRRRRARRGVVLYLLTPDWPKEGGRETQVGRGRERPAAHARQLFPEPGAFFVGVGPRRRLNTLEETESLTCSGLSLGEERPTWRRRVPLGSTSRRHGPAQLPPAWAARSPVKLSSAVLLAEC